MLGRSRLPSLAKEGWTRHQEISPFLLKARTGWFVQTPKQFLLNEPPRLRPLWWLRDIFLMAQPVPSFAKEGTLCLNSRRRLQPAATEYFRGLEYRLFRRHGRIFQRRRERNGNMHRSDPLYRSLQIVKRSFGDHRRDFRGHPITLIAFVDDNRSRRFLCRPDEGFLVQRPNRTWIDDFGTDIELFKQLRGANRHLNHAARRYNRDVAPRALDVGHAERNRVLFHGYRPFQPVHHLVFKEHDRIVVPDSGLQKPFGVVRR